MMQKREKTGITLIALIITIIVMLILVAVTISMAMKSGLFGYAGEGSKKMKNAINDESFLATGMIIDDTIGDYKYGNSNQIRFVEYNNCKFFITGFKDNRVVLTPLTFPSENQIMLSGKYKAVNNKKVSVSLDDPEATADASFEAFTQRMKEELDNACQTRYGTNDGKIISYNADSDTDIAEFIMNIDYRNEVNNVEELLAKDVETIRSFFDGLNYEMPQMVSEANDELLDNYISFLYNGFERGLTNQIEDYGFTVPTLDETDMQEISLNVKSLIRGNITTEGVNTTKNVSRYIAILFYDYFKYYVFNATYLSGVTTTITHRDGNGVDYYTWRMDIYDAIDSYTIYTPLKEEYLDGQNEDQFNTVTCKIYPILLVDPGILQRTGQHTYTLNLD